MLTQNVHIKLAAALDARQRAMVHEAADAASLAHESRDDDTGQRCLHLGDLQRPAVRPRTQSMKRMRFALGAWPGSADGPSQCEAVLSFFVTAAWRQQRPHGPFP